ncbi:MAG TPA: hypothetical protein VF666_06965 [Pyrinomonadaceae bacterium]|jgi:hypothetical protein
MSSKTLKTSLPIALKKLLLVALAISLLAVPRPVSACGPFSLEAVFTFRAHPDFPLERFARGDIGVLQPTYARSYLFAAYRHMAGAGFNEAEQKALVALWNERLENYWESPATNWIARWAEMRARVGSVGKAPSIEVYRATEKPDEHDTFYNCHEDAFITATATLDERIKKFGAEHPSLKSWVEAQDQVFANCSEGQRIPPYASADADPLIRADRAYQIAAANFYATRFDDARRAFDEIARDASSPWRTRAPYLAARAMLRKGSLNEEPVKTEAFGEAEKQLQRVLEDRSLAATHDDARRLLGLVRLRLRPAERLRELAESALRRDAQKSLKQDVLDYTLILDKFINDEPPPSERKFKDLPNVGRDDDVTDWVMTFQVTDADALRHSLQKWEKTSTLPWLVASLSKINVGHKAIPSLLEAASRVEPESGAFVSVVFHSVRLLTEAGRDDEARRRLDALLTQDRATFPPSALNLLLSQRMRLARDLDEFLRFAQRVPSAFSYNEDGRQLPADTKELEKDEHLKTYVGGRTLFDDDAASIMNRHMPLALLRDAARSNVLPDSLRREVAVAAWVRAVLLNDREADRELTPVLVALVPEMRGYLNADVDGTDDARKFSALYAILKFPGVSPYVGVGVARETPVKEIDNYRNNWWCSFDIETSPSTSENVEKTADSTSKDAGSTDSASRAATRARASSFKFLNASQVAAASREGARLASLGTAPNHLSRLAVEWGNKFPDDPRVPEALHLAVKSTRYGCSDQQTGALSKAAHTLLHRRYPRSEWTKKTPYWFKGT